MARCIAAPVLEHGRESAGGRGQRERADRRVREGAGRERRPAPSRWRTTTSTPFRSGAEASAIAYIQIKLDDGRTFWGAAMDPSIELASIKAVLGAVNRALS